MKSCIESEVFVASKANGRIETMHICVILFMNGDVFFASALIAEDTLEVSKAAHKIQLLGGKFERDETLASRPVIGISLAGSQKFNDKYIHLLRSIPSVRTLDLIDTKITDGGLLELKALDNLKSLSLGGTITDNGLKNLHELDGLLQLIHCETSATADGIMAFTDAKRGQDIFTSSVLRWPA